MIGLGWEDRVPQSALAQIADLHARWPAAVDERLAELNAPKED
jgi:hypothetical protein